MTSFKKITLAITCIFIISCGTLANLTGGSSGVTDTPTNSDESNVEAVVSSLIDETNNASTSSSSPSASAVSSLTTFENFLTKNAYGHKRFQCAETAQVTENFSCSNVTGSMSSSVLFTDCVLENNFWEPTLNGSFDNAITDGGDSFCAATYIYLDRLAAGAVHTHETGANGMVFAYTNAKGRDITLTRTASRTITVLSVTDENEDGANEAELSEMELDAHAVRTHDDTTMHDVNVFTLDGSFEAEDENGDPVTVTTTLPQIQTTFSNHRMSEHTILSGNKIVDHNLAQLRVVFSVGEEGLTHKAGYCDPYEGTMTFAVYEINDDETIGQEVGTGSVVYADGAVSSSTYEGTSFDVHTRPCD